MEVVIPAWLAARMTGLFGSLAKAEKIYNLKIVVAEQWPVETKDKIESLKSVYHRTPTDVFTTIAEILEDHEARLQALEARFPQIVFES